MKVLLIFFTDPPRAFSTSVAALAPVVRAAGHEPVALEIRRKDRIVEVAARIDALAPEVIGVSTMTRDWPGASALLTRLRVDPFVVAGGYHATFAADDVAACPAVDAIGIGDGERPLAALLHALAAGERPQSGPGLWVRGPEGYAPPIPGADPVTDIRALPRWDYDVFGDVRGILGEGINTFGPLADGYLPTRAGRGCPFTCAYCSAPRWGALQGFGDRRLQNTRPVDHLCDELEVLRDRYAPEGFEFWDEHFPIAIPWLEEFAEVYPRRVGLPFKVEMHPSAATRPRLELLARAGCALFHCGIEAGDADFRRDVLHRRTPDAQLQRVFDECRELGLETSASLMTMLPGETRAHTRSTADLLRRLRPGSFMWSTYHPLPGTVLGDRAVTRWPGPAGETFEDHAAVEVSTPPAVDARERAETFRELAEMQATLVDRAALAAGRPRPRPIEIPRPRRPTSRALAELLGLAPPGATKGRARARLAALEEGALIVEVEHPTFGVREIQIAALEGSRHFVEAARVGLSYRGREAPRELLELLRVLAARLGAVGLDDLRAAFEREDRSEAI